MPAHELAAQFIRGTIRAQGSEGIILLATQSSVQFGDKAPRGAILIVTKMNGDKRNP